jgi:hypothetical protein
MDWFTAEQHVPAAVERIGLQPGDPVFVAPAGPEPHRA